MIETSDAPDLTTPTGTTRRQVLMTGGIVVAAVAVTAACGSSSSAAPPAAGPDSTSPAPSSPAASSPASGGTTVKTSDVAVGGGEILAEQKVVVTQPTSGTFKAFTAVCTHQGCLVASISDGLIHCPCHGSVYSIVDGSVKGGPAPAPLAAVPITVSGTTITLA